MGGCHTGAAPIICCRECRHRLLLCNSTSAYYRLGYHEIKIIASPFLQEVKELLLHNYFSIYTISLSTSLPLRLCGAVILVPLI